ncbi:MAG TPA: hypothetical protein VGF33_09835 [Caulobacteraceae bacterium]
MMARSGAGQAAQATGRTLGLALVLMGVSTTAARAVPAFAAQTGQPCSTCHVGGFGPQLTEFGRNFKLNGYTARTVGFNVPLSAMAVASYVRTQKDQDSPPAPHYSANDNATIDQVSLFIAGGYGHFGAFIQTTYDGVARAFHWDNVDLRAVTKTSIKGKDVVLGLSLNNAPTVQDAWNTLPGWGYPYTTSSLAPSPGAAPIIGAFAQNTIGLTAYTWINSQIYLEAGGYASPGASFLTHAGADPASPGNINGVAPYARVAFDKNWGGHSFEIGAFGMHANIFPGHDESTGMTDHYSDFGVDASFQRMDAKNNVITVNGRFIYEDQRLDASQALGMVAANHLHLQDLRVDASYYWRNEIGFTVAAFDTWGTPDQLLFGDNSTFKPSSSGLMFQLDGTPFGGGNSPLGKRFNMRVGVQYINYFSFDGSGQNYDGLGRNASDNNTLRVFTWIAY